MKVVQFSGDYYFLSNYYPSEFTWNGVVWQHAEGAYQAAKVINRDYWTTISQVKNPAVCRQKTTYLPKRRDWNDVRVEIMREIINEKFTQNPILLTRLLDTETQLLEHGNWWSDVFWGICPVGSDVGENNLGKILMNLRNQSANK